MDASISGAGGTEVRPAPSRAERSRAEPEWVRRVLVDPLAVAREDPSAAESSRLDPRVMVEAVPAASPRPAGPEDAEDPGWAMEIGEEPAPAGRGEADTGPGLPQTSQ